MHPEKIKSPKKEKQKGYVLAGLMLIVETREHLLHGPHANPG